MTGAANIEEVMAIKTEIIDLLGSGGFPLRKFASNNDNIIADIPESDKEVNVNIGDFSYIKALRLKWSPQDDVFMFSYTPYDPPSSKVSKRVILSKIATFFDPLGLLNPNIVTCKLLMHELWKLKLSWDESVPMSIHTQWTFICHQITSVNKVRVPRFVHFNVEAQLHAFADASTRAYGACIYAVSHSGGTTHASLICAKSRVAPTKEITLPKLELCAAVLLAELVQSVATAFSAGPSNIHCWSDSTIVLSWIQGEPTRWTTFVANRVIKIQQLTANYTWHHVPSEENPADIVSRGAKVHDLIGNNLWFHGPIFLQQAESRCPENPMNNMETLPERRKKHHALLTAHSEA
ncbi:PREDICTED: uncharacterized protein LOC108364926 [Rhagoletis zephyria]|uniref:uncharacterized protein LOC108364926 n=1 Tax=Rhagoletis zephyria TaxID=28612 RepID=UPI0008112D6D|nr:PREDICTED: uncharacterized protein LOC108364926 [Rhagoletis zephyria]